MINHIFIRVYFKDFEDGVTNSRRLVIRFCNLFVTFLPYSFPKGTTREGMRLDSKESNGNQVRLGGDTS